MFTSGSIKPWPVGTRIHWIDRDRDRQDWGTIVDIRLGHYTVKNFKNEQRIVNINDHSIRVLFGPDTPTQIAVPLTELDKCVDDIWFSWKAK